MKALLNAEVSTEGVDTARTVAQGPQKPALPPSGLSSWLADMTSAGYNQSLNLSPGQSMAAAEAWDAAVPMAQAWALGSGAA